MNNSETGYNDISGQIEALKRQNLILHLALIVVSGTLVFFLCYQAHVAKSNLESFRLQTQQMIKSYNALNRSGIDTFVNQITAYANTHPDFEQQVLKKYGYVPSSNTSVKK